MKPTAISRLRKDPALFKKAQEIAEANFKAKKHNQDISEKPNQKPENTIQTQASRATTTEASRPSTQAARTVVNPITWQEQVNPEKAQQRRQYVQAESLRSNPIIEPYTSNKVLVTPAHPKNQHKPVETNASHNASPGAKMIFKTTPIETTSQRQGIRISTPEKQGQSRNTTVVKSVAEIDDTKGQKPSGKLILGTHQLDPNKVGGILPHLSSSNESSLRKKPEPASMKITDTITSNKPDNLIRPTRRQGIPPQDLLKGSGLPSENTTLKPAGKGGLNKHSAQSTEPVKTQVARSNQKNISSFSIGWN